MKKLMLTALTILPLVTTPMVAQPASADVTIKVPIFSGQSRSTVQERRNSRRIYRRTNSRQARRIRRQRRQWVRGDGPLDGEDGFGCPDITSLDDIGA